MHGAPATGAPRSGRRATGAGSRRRRLRCRLRGRLLPNLRRRYEEGSWTEREALEEYRALRPVPTCDGVRLRPESRNVRVKGRTHRRVRLAAAPEALALVDAIKLSPRETLIASRILREVQQRLQFLTDVGVGYLTLGRSAATLSGGEGQRIRLATQIGSSLTGVLYVLDEPSIGLHQRDNRQLLATLGRLRDLGNTVIVVEHDEETIRTADYVVDLGPGAGEHGGTRHLPGAPVRPDPRRRRFADQRLPRAAAAPSRRRSAPAGGSWRHPCRRRAGQQPQEPHGGRSRSGGSSPSRASAVRASRRS